jgi:5-dehydro-2-deoxygluconokinase
MREPRSDRSIDVVAMGRSCIDLYAHEVGVPITMVRSFDSYVGGCPTNVSVGISRLGKRALLLTGVGDDQVAEFVLHFLAGEGVDLSAVALKPGRRTSAVILTIQPPDSFPLTYYRDNCADIALTVDDVDRTPIADARVLFISGTGLSKEPSCTATLYAQERAREADVRVVLDLDYRPDQWSDVRTYGAAVRAAAGRSCMVIGTEDEVRAAAGGAVGLDEAVSALLGTGVPALVLKRGERGATIYQRCERARDVAPFHVQVLNVLGAGDAFASGLLNAWLEGWPLEHAVRFGNATGAIVVTRHSCANDMPTRAEVEAFVKEQGGWGFEIDQLMLPAREAEHL